MTEPEKAPDDRMYMLKHGHRVICGACFDKLNGHQRVLYLHGKAQWGRVQACTMCGVLVAGSTDVAKKPAIMLPGSAKFLVGRG